MLRSVRVILIRELLISFLPSSDINGWYRYDSRFALPVYDDKGELERYNVFHASMLVRHSNDGKMYLYDVIDIKKETSNSLGE